MKWSQSHFWGPKTRRRAVASHMSGPCTQTPFLYFPKQFNRRSVCPSAPEDRPIVAGPLVSVLHVFGIELRSKASINSGLFARASFASAYVIHLRPRLCISGHFASSLVTVTSKNWNIARGACEVNWLVARRSGICPRSFCTLHMTPASSHASRHAASWAVFSSVSQPPLGITQPLRRVDWINKTFCLSAERGTTPATSRSPFGPYPTLSSVRKEWTQFFPGTDVCHGCHVPKLRSQGSKLTLLISSRSCSGFELL